MITFSGKRENRLYRISESTCVNADLNGSANIGRKAFGEYSCASLLDSSKKCSPSWDRVP